ncbi:DUF4855 domain-containing protein [Paenibacillus thermotolerans]|uniref:DUF4855 domain-containing protein n=1 Tax=Paenibacillus thermotolerans TaxID=3027807 RepID=UPI002368359B|nr:MULTISPECIES: DUF4855 domain-containing protein [unclassified Paenibacillus]
MPLLTPASSGLNNHIVHCGYLRSVTGSQIRSWTKEDLLPNILYVDNGNIADSMFGGLLFEADRSINEEIMSGKAIGFGKPPTMTAWKQALDVLFQKDRNLSMALQISALRPKGNALDLWVALPYPLETKQDFGVYKGRQLNFQANPSDREIALTWWIDRLLEAWNYVSRKASGHNARLCGFAWTKNSLEPNDESLLAAISRYIHDKKLKLIWCQNYGTAKAWEGSQLGFDFVFTRPLFANKDPRGAEWVKSAVSFCNKYQLGVIVWGDPRVSLNQLPELLNIGRELFAHSLQIFEIGEVGAGHLFKTSDPLYRTLHSYIKGV